MSAGSGTPTPHRQVPVAIYYCPYCGGEDLRPHDPFAAGVGESAGVGGPGWECRGCARVFTVRFLGLSTSVLEVKR